MVEIVVAQGLGPERLEWVAALYGNANPKYRRQDFLEHLFARSPAGTGLHAFAVDTDGPVGHCAVVPLPGRLGSEPLAIGKLEALFLAESHRGRGPDGRPVVRSLLERLYAFADEQGIRLIHAFATPYIGHVIGFEPLRVGNRSRVALVAGQSSFARAIAVAQRLVREAGHAAARLRARKTDTVLRLPGPEDVALAAAPMPPPGHWTSVAQDAWEWYCQSPVVRVLELAGPHGFRALVQVPGTAGEPLRLVGWRAASSGLVPAVVLLGALGRLARTTAAAGLFFQPWSSDAANGALAHACRLLGFVTRDDLATLWVRSPDPALARAEAIVPSPLFYLGF